MLHTEAAAELTLGVKNTLRSVQWVAFLKQLGHHGGQHVQSIAEKMIAKVVLVESAPLGGEGPSPLDIGMTAYFITEARPYRPYYPEDYKALRSTYDSARAAAPASFTPDSASFLTSPTLSSPSSYSVSSVALKRQVDSLTATSSYDTLVEELATPDEPNKEGAFTIGFDCNSPPPLHKPGRDKWFREV